MIINFSILRIYFVRFTKCYSRYQVKENEMGGTCSTRGKHDKYDILVGKPLREEATQTT